jgi:transposase
VYERKSQISARKKGRLIEHFVAGTTLRATAEIVRVGQHSYLFLNAVEMLIASKLPIAGQPRLLD